MLTYNLFDLYKLAWREGGKWGEGEEKTHSIIVGHVVISLGELSFLSFGKCWRGPKESPRWLGDLSMSSFWTLTFPWSPWKLSSCLVNECHLSSFCLFLRTRVSLHPRWIQLIRGVQWAAQLQERQLTHYHSGWLYFKCHSQLTLVMPSLLLLETGRSNNAP